MPTFLYLASMHVSTAYFYVCNNTNLHFLITTIKTKIQEYFVLP
jgi:hypothetical protein